MTSFLRTTLVTAVIVAALPASGGGFVLGKYSTVEVDFRNARKEFRQMVRAQPALRKIHARQLAGLTVKSIKYGGSWGALVGGSAAWVWGVSDWLTPAAWGVSDWRTAAAGALAAGALTSYAVGAQHLRDARTETVRRGVADGMVSKAQARRLEAAELITRDWAIDR